MSEDVEIWALSELEPPNCVINGKMDANTPQEFIREREKLAVYWDDVVLFGERNGRLWPINEKDIDEKEEYFNHRIKLRP